MCSDPIHQEWCKIVLIYLYELVEGDLAIFVLVHCLTELLDDLTHSVSRQRKISHFEQLIQLICADVAIRVQIWMEGSEEVKPNTSHVNIISIIKFKATGK